MKKIYFVCCSKYREELAAASTISGPLLPWFLSASSSSAEQCSFPNGSLDHGACIRALHSSFSNSLVLSFRGTTISHRQKRVNSVTGWANRDENQTKPWLCQPQKGLEQVCPDFCFLSSSQHNIWYRYDAQYIFVGRSEGWEWVFKGI